MKKIIVTTGDLKKNYEVIGPVYYQISNKGVFSSQLAKMEKQYAGEIEDLKKKGLTSEDDDEWGLAYGEVSIRGSAFDIAFFVSVQELKLRADRLGADAVIGMRQDIDLDTNSFKDFYLQMYGTAVRYK